MAIGERVRALRERDGMTQEELAQRIGVSKMLISHIERGYRSLTMPVAAEMAAVFGCTLDELCGRA